MFIRALRTDLGVIPLGFVE